MSIVLTLVLLFSPQTFAVNSDCAATVAGRGGFDATKNIIRPNEEQQINCSAFWSNQIEEARLRGNKAADLEFLESILRIAKAATSIDLNWTADALISYLQGHRAIARLALTPTLLDQFDRHPKQLKMTLLTQFALYGLSLTPTGRERISETLKWFFEGDPELMFSYTLPASDTFGEYRFVRQNGERVSEVALNIDETLMTQILGFGHELMHASDDLNLGLFKTYKKGTRHCLFIEHRGYWSQYKIAKEFSSEYPEAAYKNRVIAFSLLLDRDLLGRMLRDNYEISDMQYKAYMHTHSFEVFPVNEY